MVIYLSIKYNRIMKDNKDLVVLGQNIKIERVRRNLTQEQLVNISGSINAQHLGKIEKGEVDVRATTLFSILRALDCKLEDLIDLGGDNNG